MSQNAPSSASNVGVVGEGRALELVRERGFHVDLVDPAGPRLRAADGTGLLVLDAQAIGRPNVVETLGRLRNIAPLLNVVVWAPGAPAGFVRDVLRAEVADVVLGTSAKDLGETIDRNLEGRGHRPRLRQLAAQRARGSRYEGMVSRSAVMWDVFELCERVADTDATVLIVSETGTGKEMLARAIHRRSKRKGNFVPVNCSALPETLIEAELFGHEQGSFTGASAPKMGLVRHADGGTLFLDEVGDMPLQAQLSLLRLLQEGTVRPVGGSQEIPVDVRVVAATNVQLDEAVEEGQFRADLFYRLDVIRMTVPPLRERSEDIIYLLGYFIKKLCKHYSVPHPDLSDGFMDAVIEYDWPGNVRQLENFVERLVLGAKRGRLTRGDFARMLRPGEEPVKTNGRRTSGESGSSRPPRINPAQSLQDNIDPIIVEVEREYLEAVLKQFNGRVGDAAQHAGISRRTLLRKMTTYGIDKQQYKPAS